MADETAETIGESQIKKIFAGSTVLITGGTGFIGKLLVEKLLRSCTKIKKIYLLARPKKGKDIEKRLDEQFEDVLYDKLRKEQPDFTQKVVAVPAYIGAINLGLNEEDRKRITEEVSFIFHGAATVKFNEPLKTAVQVNVRGTREMLLLAKACPKLKAFVHISTAYGNCRVSEIDEVFYDSQLSGEKLIDLMEDLDEAVIERITPDFISGFPNTYAYSKLAAEDLIKSYSKSLPVAVVRPAVVTGTQREPLEGWIDNVYGPTGAILGGGLGILHVMKTDPDIIANIIPGDMVINCCIAAAWKVVKDSSCDCQPQDYYPPIYNFVSCEQSPITWDMKLDIASTEQVLRPKQGGDITYKDMVDEIDALGESQISKLFAGSTILVTGGTGFLGKLMVEKLLRSCSDLYKIYLLARPKKNKDINKRLEEQFNDVLYDKLRKEQPDFIQKVSLVEGDVGELNLGLSDEDRTRITKEVEFIFHGAATVKFNEALKTAVQINVRGTREMFLLAKACPKLRAMVHISTAYGNCRIGEIDEIFYDSQLSGEKLIDLVETLDEAVIDRITPSLISDFPNTYIYTKLAAEDIIRKYSKGLPVAVLRPAIITGTQREPVAGWIDNVYGPTGVAVGAAIGLLHVLKCNPNVVADLVPGDMVVNCCIAAAWKVVKDFPCNFEDAPPPESDPPIYNYVSSVERPVTWGDWMNKLETYGLDIPTTQAVWYYLLVLTPSNTLYRFISLILHWMPAYIIDAIAVLLGKKPMLRKTYDKIDKFSDVLSFFSTREWKFHNGNTRKLFSEMCAADKHIFDFNIQNLDWNEYCINVIRGIRVYLLKDPIDTIPQGKRLFYKLKVCHYALTAIVTLVLLRVLWAIIRLIF